MRHGLFLIICFVSGTVPAQFVATQHKAPTAGIIPVSKPGSYGRAGSTYMLVNDISSATSAIFLGKDVTLDLNGYTIRYADAQYEHILNGGFENGTDGWDLSTAPGAKVVSTDDVHVFIGKKILSLKKGDVIKSGWITLPVAKRSYFAMCGVTGHDYQDMKGDLDNQMKVSVYVENEKGEDIRTVTDYGDSVLVSCPVENKPPRLGGGFVYAHLHDLPVGRYRVRVKAETDCLIDEVDIRPALDVGIGIVEKTYPTVHNDHLYRGSLSAFFDYTSDPVKGIAHDHIPKVDGAGTVTIKNGFIESAATGIVSWGVQSTAGNVKIILDNVSIKTAGINSIAAELPQATITHCKFEVDNPFIINRHNSNFYAVDLPGSGPSEVSYSEFFGGQGCLVFKGKESSIHHNYFVNKQMVTNHYSIMAMGDSSKIFQNRIEPETGSGIEIYRHKYIEIFDNSIRIATSPPTCEYGHDLYSTSAIRLADYRTKPGDPTGCFGNKVYNNKIHIVGLPQKGVGSFIPASWAIYYSASGGDNEVFGNDITIEKPDQSNAVVTGFYICGGTEGYGGMFYNNRIASNVPAIWVATMYGGAANSRIFNNTIIHASQTATAFMPVKIGADSGSGSLAKNIEFRSNEIQGASFGIESSGQDHSYSVYWTASIQVVDKKGRALGNRQVKIIDSHNHVVFSDLTDERGMLEVELLEYEVDPSGKKIFTPHTFVTGRGKKTVEVDKNMPIILVGKDR